MGRLRREWQAQGLREVVLDGESVADDVKLIEQLFSTLFPFPKAPLEEVTKPALVRWLKSLNLSPDACEMFAADVCYESMLRASHYTPGLRSQLFAALLAEGGGECGLVFVLEDLHKVSPSVLSVLGEGLLHLRTCGRGKVFVLLTSRPAREGGTLDITSEWLKRLQELSALTDEAVTSIAPLSEHDARDILQQTSPSLQATHVRQIVRQVGTSPLTSERHYSTFASLTSCES